MRGPRALRTAAPAALATIFFCLAAPASACEPIHDLLRFGGPGAGVIACTKGQVLCSTDARGNPTSPCLACNVTGSQQLCWASQCRGFNGDTGQYGQFKKDKPGELEALIMTVENLRTGKVVTLVDKIQSPTCASLIPTGSGGLSCSKLYKVKDVRPVKGTSPGPLCAFSTLDDVNTIARTPMSQKVVLTDANGSQCEARKKVGDQWWMFYQTCCSPTQEFGEIGDPVRTTTKMIIDQDGVCLVDPVRPDQSEPETIPAQEAAPCL